MEKIDLRQALTEVLNFSEQIMEQGDIDVSVVDGGDQMFMKGDTEMIKQVFLNIILNAQQSMPDGGILSIKSITSSAGILPGESPAAEIIFQDSGPGIPEENLSRIFDPFFSTKEGGAGLGLAIVHNIISQHKGSITVENSPRGGTKVSISFPLLKEITEKLEKTAK